jgi:hypothetical protein
MDLLTSFVACWNRRRHQRKCDSALRGEEKSLRPVGCLFLGKGSAGTRIGNPPRKPHDNSQKLLERGRDSAIHTTSFGTEKD